jgi:hypothetical protein
MARQLPPYTYRYFWDIDPARLDVDEYSTYVLERLLEYGDRPSVSWMLEHFSRQEIVGALQTSHRLSPLSANFWALYFGLDKERVPCLSKPYPREQDEIWPY